MGEGGIERKVYELISITVILSKKKETILQLDGRALQVVTNFSFSLKSICIIVHLQFN